MENQGPGSNPKLFMFIFEFLLKNVLLISKLIHWFSKFYTLYQAKGLGEIINKSKLLNKLLKQKSISMFNFALLIWKRKETRLKVNARPRVCQDHLWQDHVFPDHVFPDHVCQDHVKTNLIQFDQFWSILINFDQFWSILNQSNPFWYDLFFNWFKLIQFVPIWSNSIQFESSTFWQNWPKFQQILRNVLRPLLKKAIPRTAWSKMTKNWTTYFIK